MSSLKISHLRLLLVVFLVAAGADAQLLCDETLCRLNGRCVDDGRCECDWGYQYKMSLDDGLLHCQPICAFCPSNGHCVGPEKCACDGGYELAGDLCQPQSAERSTAPSSHDRTTPATTLETTTPSGDMLYTQKGEFANGEVTHSHSCPQNYIDVDGDCQPTLIDQCNVELCGANSYCYDAEHCACLPGFQWLHSVHSIQGHCVDWQQIKRDALIPTTTTTHNTLSYLMQFFTLIGMVCISIAVVVLIIVLYKGREKIN